MSSLASLFNSSASLFTVDIYEKLRPGQSEQHLLTWAASPRAVVVALGMIWIPVMAKISGGGLYQYLQSVQGYLAPPITAVFFLGLFWKRINAAGAAWGLAGGFVLGMIKLTIQTFYGKGKSSRTRPSSPRSATSTSSMPPACCSSPASSSWSSLLYMTPPPPRGEDSRPHLWFHPPDAAGRDQEPVGTSATRSWRRSSCSSWAACISISASG